MDLTTYIEDLSMSMHSAQLEQQVQISMLRKRMDAEEASVEALIGMGIDLNIDPNVGRKLDVSA